MGSYRAYVGLGILVAHIDLHWILDACCGKFWREKVVIWRRAITGNEDVIVTTTHRPAGSGKRNKDTKINNGKVRSVLRIYVPLKTFFSSPFSLKYKNDRVENTPAVVVVVASILFLRQTLCCTINPRYSPQKVVGGLCS